MSTIESFELNISTLNRNRRVWVYLPDGYDEKGARYPVIYMHDGQNLFYDELTAYGAAWHVDKCVDDIYSKTGKACIVVGVECDGERRLSEYSPWKASFAMISKRKHAGKENRGGEGAAYSEWFATTLKSYIDEHYNTDPTRNATAVAGSSMGGLISCYLGLKFQHLYQTMGLFSTYTQFNQGAFNGFVRATPQVEKQHAFVYCGGKEWGDDLVASQRIEKCAHLLYAQLKQRGVSCQLVLDSDQPHYETAWEIHFYKFAQEFLNRYYESKTKQ